VKTKFRTHMSTRVEDRVSFVYTDLYVPKATNGSGNHSELSGDNKLF